MNYWILLKMNAAIVAALSMGFAASLGVALTMDPAQSGAVLGFGICLIASLFVSALCFLIARNQHNRVFQREAIAIVGTGWMVATALGALPYLLIIDGMSIADAIFESGSGFTTTGASVLTDLESLPPSILLWRAMTQWIGGLGVAVFFVAVLSFLGAGAKVMFSRESSAQATELDAARIQKGALDLLRLYLGLSISCVFVYWACGLGLFDAITHMFTTLSTGGFSTRSASVGAFENPAFEWATILFMALGGTSFIFILRIFRGEWRTFGRASEVRAYYMILAASTAIIVFFLIPHQPDTDFSSNLRAAAFQVTSIMTTTGFVTADFDLWPAATHAVLLVLMIIGGCSGSTAGGTKVLRVLIAAKVAMHNVERTYRSRVVRPLKWNRETLDPSVGENVTLYLTMIGLLGFGSLLVLSFLEPTLSLNGAIATIAASFFNIGPGFAEVGPTQTFAFFSDTSKIFLTMLMILGRLELFALLALLSPGLWRKF